MDLLGGSPKKIFARAKTLWGRVFSMWEKVFPLKAPNVEGFVSGYPL